jgi:outer membrane protein TolC
VSLTRVLLHAFVIVVLALGARTAGATDDDELRLSDFVAEVAQRSPAVTASMLRKQAARTRITGARALPDPFVAVGLDEIALGRAEEDGMRTYPRPVVRYQVNQTFPVGAKLRAREQVARATADVLDADVEITRRTLRVAAVQLFLRALYVQEALATNAKLGEAVEDVIAAAEARYVTGGSAHHDVLLATAERAVLRRDESILRRTLAVLHAEMNELRGIPAHRAAPRLVDDAIARPHAPVSFGAALARQPELRGADRMVAAADTRIRAAKTTGFPDVSVQVMAMQSLTPAMPSSLGMMIGISVPIYWRRKQAPGIDAAKIERRAAQHDREGLRRRLEAEWVAARTTLDSGIDTVRLYEREVLPALRAALESSKAAYITEKVPLVELLGIVRTTLTAELEYTAARIDVRLARLRMEELLSMPNVVRLAPATPTLLGSGGAMPGMGAGMGGGMSSGARPIRMGTGMQPPASLDTGEGDAGMAGMR